MKRLLIPVTCLLLIWSLDAHAGFGGLFGKLKEKVQQAEGAVNDVKGTVRSAREMIPADTPAAKSSAQSNNARTNGARTNGAQNDSENESGSSVAASQQPDIRSYKNYDFVPGDKIIFESQLGNEEVGEIPSQFGLSSGQLDIEQDAGENVIRIPKGAGATFSPRINKKNYLPDQFTVEFDFKNERFGLAHLSVKFGDDSGAIREINFGDGGGLSWTTGDLDTPDGLKLNSDYAMVWHHIAIAVNKNDGKVYIDQYRVANVNNISGKPESIILDVDGYEDSFIKNLRIAAGGIDTYKEVMSDGKIVTHGIRFDVGKAAIKPLSMGEINSIDRLLVRHASLKFEIDGHTDSTGDAKANLVLSKERADAVKAQLVSMGIDARRLTTRGFGDTRPMASNRTPEGRANNRRVEFVKT